MFRFVLPFLVFLPFSVSAQFSINEYLAGAASDFELQIMDEQRDYLGSGKFTSPILRGVQLRAQTPDLQSGPNDFTFRVSPLNPYERKANKSHRDIIKRQLSSQRLVTFSGVLEARYALLIQCYYLKKLDSIKIREVVRYQQLIQGNAESTKELLQLNEKLFKSEMDQVVIESKMDEVYFLIKNSYSFEGEVTFDGLEMVSVSTISNNLEKSSPGLEENIFLQNEKNKALLSASEWEINRQESFSNIGFLQAEYRPEPGVGFSETMGIQLAVELPIVNPDRPDLERRKLDLLKDENDVKVAQKEINTDLFQVENELKALIKQYLLVKGQHDRINQLQKSGLSNKSTALGLAEFVDDLKINELQLYRSILNSYIRWLNMNSQLIQTPMVNYLSADRVRIENME